MYISSNRSSLRYGGQLQIRAAIRWKIDQVDYGHLCGRNSLWGWRTGPPEEYECWYNEKFFGFFFNSQAVLYFGCTASRMSPIVLRSTFAANM